VAGLGITALEGLITDVLQMEQHDFHDLVETRIVLEKQTAAFAAIRRTDDDIVKMTNALHAYDAKVKANEPAIEEDLMFHLAIAEASKNGALKSLMMIITPDIVSNFVNLRVCENDKIYKSQNEHELILRHIINQDADAAGAAMILHLNDVLDFSRTKLL